MEKGTDREAELCGRKRSLKYGGVEMILTMVVSEGNQDRRQIDVMIKPEQRIQEVYRELLENGYFAPVSHERQIRVYSFRQEGYVNPMLTFRQGGIYGGDILGIL